MRFRPFRTFGLCVSLSIVGCASTPKAPPPEATAQESESAVVGSGPAQKARFPSPREIFERIEKSERKYVIRPAESASFQKRQQNANATWPRRVQEIDCTHAVADGDGRWKMVPCPPNAEVEKLINEAEVHWEAKDYAQSEKFYERAVAIAPDNYLAHIFYGDAAYAQKRLDEALVRYTKAGAVNPHDHRSWYFRGNVLLDQGKTDEALEMYARGLALRPRHQPMRIGLENREQVIGHRIEVDLLLPKSMASLNGEAVDVETVSQSHWMAWALCKALWIGEPSHRVEMTGSERHTFSTTEELECLSALMAHYLDKRNKGEIEPEVELDRVEAVIKAGMAAEFVLFELGSRIAPNITVTLPDDQREKVVRYVRQFVLVPTNTSAPTKL